ncbi:MAG: TfuA-like protein [Pseudomonadota bacterium]
MSETPHAPPVIYLGPSAPRADIAALLPNAVIRPPARRGDLYRDRMLRFSVFLLIDGVFAQEQAISPREVVDVRRDGARVVGASSMGALRACDCAPAGVEGIGTIFRLFRSGAVNSEDEVAVTFRPDAVFPPLTLSLVSVRIALRRAVRARRLGSEDARSLAAATEALHYSERTWSRILATAGILVDPETLTWLRASDAKREDAQLAAMTLARRLKRSPSWAHCPRRAGNSTFGLLEHGRERPFALTDEMAPQELVPGFVVWILATGRSARWLAPETTALNLLARLATEVPDDLSDVMFSGASVANAGQYWDLYEEIALGMDASCEREAEWLRYHSARLFDKQGRLAPPPNALDMALAGMQIADRLGCDDWAAALAAAGSGGSALVKVQTSIARGKSFRRGFLNAGQRHD